MTLTRHEQIELDIHNCEEAIAYLHKSIEDMNAMSTYRQTRLKMITKSLNELTLSLQEQLKSDNDGSLYYEEKK